MPVILSGAPRTTCHCKIDGRVVERSRGRFPLHTAAGNSLQNVGTVLFDTWEDAVPAARERTGTRSRENSLHQHGRGRDVGISRLRASLRSEENLYTGAALEMTAGGILVRTLRACQILSRSHCKHSNEKSLRLHLQRSAPPYIGFCSGSGNTSSLRATQT